jgi:hypothetical protein
MSVPPKGNSLPKMGKELPIPRRLESSSAYAAQIAKALRKELGGSNRAIKTLMRWTQASERTAKCWLAGASGPSGEHLVRLIRNSDAVLEAVLELAQRRPTLERGRLEALKWALSNAVLAIDETLNSEERIRQPPLPLIEDEQR